MEYTLELPTMDLRDFIAIPTNSPADMRFPCCFTYVGHKWDSVAQAFAYTNAVVVGHMSEARQIKSGTIPVTDYPQIRHPGSGNWTDMRQHALHSIVMSRFTSDKAALDWLLGTGTATLCWIDEKDLVLGMQPPSARNATPPEGANEYGRVLMAVRRYLKTRS